MAMKRLLIAAFAILACLMFAWATGAGRPYPASAGGVIDPTCTSSLPCIEYDNNGAGPGIRGVSLTGNGSNGITKVNSTSATNGREGVFGNDMSTSGLFNSGVRGLSTRGTGVSGQSTSGSGELGQSTNGQGVLGISSTGSGVIGTSTNSVGVYGAGVYGTYGAGSGYGALGLGGTIGTYGSGTSYGAYGISDAGRGVFAASFTGTAVYATTGSGKALEAHATSGLGAYITNGSGNGGDVTGTYIGIVGRATSFPFVATDPSGGNLFYVDGTGNVFYHGSLHHFAATRTGKTAITYGAVTASPTVEDTGSGQLINGVAMVALDPAFVQTIDPRTPYHVMLTPDGDTRGLYVASKSPNGFVVREVQGGRTSLTFDYHIYASEIGHAGQRMAVMTRAQAAVMSPRSPVLRLPSQPMVPKPVVKPNPVRQRQ